MTRGKNQQERYILGRESKERVISSEEGSGKVITDVKFRDVTNIWNEQIMFCKQIEIQMLIGSGVFCLCVCVSFVSGLLQLSVLNTPKKHTHTRNMLLFIKNADLCAVHSTSDLFIFYCFPLFIK